MIRSLGLRLAWTRKAKRYQAQVSKVLPHQALANYIVASESISHYRHFSGIIFVIYNFVRKYLVKFILLNRFREQTKSDILFTDGD